MTRVFRISVLAVQLMSSTALLAQAQGTKHFGIIGGVDFATFTGSDADGGTIDLGGSLTWSADKGSLTGFMGGLYVTIPLGAAVMFEPELVYEGKGAKYSSSVSNGVTSISGTQTYHADYLSVPLLIKYNFKPAGGPYLIGGFSVNFNVRCSSEISGDIGSQLDNAGVDPNGGCARFNPLAVGPSDAWIPLNANTTVGGIIGLGFQKARFGLEARYDKDLTDAASVDISGAPSFNVKNSVWEILLRYQFK